GRLFLGNRRHRTSRAHPEFGLWFSRFPILQLLRFPLRNHHRHHFLNVGASSTATSLFHRSCFRLDGFLLHKPEAKTLLNILSDYRPLYLFEMHLLALAFFIVLYLPFAIYDLAI